MIKLLLLLYLLVVVVVVVVVLLLLVVVVVVEAAAGVVIFSFWEDLITELQILSMLKLLDTTSKVLHCNVCNCRLINNIYTESVHTFKTSIPNFICPAPMVH
jgi:hypothetical protein